MAWRGHVCWPAISRSRSAARWCLVVVIGVSLGLACSSRRRGFCGGYADTVSECCVDHEYAHLRAICEQDLRTAGSVSAGCSQATRDLYDCAEAHACDDECREQSPDPCFQEQQAMVGICAGTPPPPPL